MRKLIGAICAATVLVLYATSCSTETMETSISITPSSLLLTVGETFNIIATVEPEGTKVSWTSSDESVASVVGGFVKALAPGKSTITASAGDKTAVCEVSVTKVPVGVVLNAESQTIYAGESFTLIATVSNSDQAVRWTSSDDKVATVDDSGTVTGIAPGEATITATVEEGSASCKVIVEKKPVVLTLEPTSRSIRVGDEITIAAKLENSDETVTWTSSDDNIATVDGNGRVKGIAEGEATITASVEELTATCVITVMKGEVKITLDITEAKLMLSEAITLKPVIENSNDSPTWQSSNTSVATVNESGVVIGVGEGSAVITGTLDGKSVQCSVEVSGEFLIASCDSLDETSRGGGIWNGGAITSEPGEFKSGSGALKVEVESGLNILQFKGIDIPKDPALLNGFRESTYALRFDLFISDLAIGMFNGGQVELSSSGTCDVEELGWANLEKASTHSNRNGWKQGWNEVELPLSSGATTGTGAIDIHAINFFRLYFMAEASGYFIIDDVRIAPVRSDYIVCLCEESTATRSAYRDAQYWQKNGSISVDTGNKAEGEASWKFTLSNNGTGWKSKVIYGFSFTFNGLPTRFDPCYDFEHAAVSCKVFIPKDGYAPEKFQLNIVNNDYDVSDKGSGIGILCESEGPWKTGEWQEVVFRFKDKVDDSNFSSFNVHQIMMLRFEFWHSAAYSDYSGKYFNVDDVRFIYVD